MKKADFVIIGGGVAGLTAMIALQKMGISATLYERSNPLKGIGAGFGLAANAMQAFDLLGMKDGVLPLGHYLDSFELLDEKGRVLAAPDTKAISKKYHQDNFAIHRADLHAHLLSQIDPSSIVTGKEAINIEKHPSHQRICFLDDTFVDANYVLIADGVHSMLRQQLLPNSIPRYAGYTCWRAVIDNTSIRLEKGTETWGAKGRFGMTPLVGNKIYWYACINSSPNNPKYAQYKVADLQNHFASYHEIIPKILRETKDQDLLWHDIIDIAPINKFAFHRILLLGDAAHATTPNLGQGACQAIEDIAVLVDELKNQLTIEQAFANFEKRRLSRTAYITNTSWRIGKIAQWDNPLLIGIRNSIMRLLPESVKQNGLNDLLKVNFIEINKKHGK